MADRHDTDHAEKTLSIPTTPMSSWDLNHTLTRIVQRQEIISTLKRQQGRVVRNNPPFEQMEGGYGLERAHVSPSCIRILVV